MLCFTLSVISCYAIADEEQLERLNYLKSLTLAQLTEVEIKLDDVFDVFDGLIKGRKVSVASGVEQNTSQAPAITTVITAQDIEAMGARDLDEVLESVPGLHVSRSEMSYRPIYIMRGIYSRDNPEILLMINGIAYKKMEGGNRGEAWAGMPVQSISRIEIIRGPGSALYGADAMSGVINIITKQADEIKGTEIGGRVGSYQTTDAWMLYGEKNKDIEVAATLQTFDSNGQKGLIQADIQTPLDRMMGTSASKTPDSVNLARQGMDARLDVAKGNLRLQANYRARRHVETGVPYSLDADGWMRSDRYGLDLSYKNQELAKNWELDTRVALYRDFDVTKMRIFPAGSMGLYPQGMGFIGGGHEQHFSAEGSAFYKGWQHHLLRIGLGYHHEQTFGSTYIANFGLDRQGNVILPGSPLVDLTGSVGAIYPDTINQINQFLYVQDAWKFAPHWELTTGLRYDRYSSFDSSTNPRLSLVWQIDKDLTAKLLYGQAFRAPAARELYSNSPSALGNRFLKPETLKMGELALDWQTTSNVHMSLNLFYYTIKDKIAFVPQNLPNVSMAGNVGNWQGHGLEFETRWKINNRSSLLFNYSFVGVRESKKTPEGIESSSLENIPHHHAYLRSDWLLEKNWYLDTQWNWISKRYRNDDDELDLRSPLKGYYTFDVTMRYKDIRDDRWNIAFGIKNLFNKDAREPASVNIPYDLPLEKRNWFIETRYRFK